MTNQHHTVLYVGSAVNLQTRCKEHIRKKTKGSFTARYNVEKLVYYKWFPTESEARNEEKRIKGGSRQKKIDLINGVNADWKDLLEEINVVK